MKRENLQNHRSRVTIYKKLKSSSWKTQSRVNINKQVSVNKQVKHMENAVTVERKQTKKGGWQIKKRGGWLRNF